MKISEITTIIEMELEKAKKKFPQWSLDPVHGAAIMAEEAGEALQAALDFYYGRGGSKKLKKEIIHTLAMAARFLMNFEDSRSWTEIFKKGRDEAIRAAEKYRRKNGEKNQI